MMRRWPPIRLFMNSSPAPRTPSSSTTKCAPSRSVHTSRSPRLSAIGNRDADTASRRMRRHVHSYAKAALAVDKRDEIAVDE
jgi:hypothetical protein